MKPILKTAFVDAPVNEELPPPAPAPDTVYGAAPITPQKMSKEQFFALVNDVRLNGFMPSVEWANVYKISHLTWTDSEGLKHCRPLYLVTPANAYTMRARYDGWLAESLTYEPIHIDNLPPVNDTEAAGFDREQRATMRDEAYSALMIAEERLNALAASYSEARDGTFSACHPRNGYQNVAGQIQKLRKALLRAKV